MVDEAGAVDTGDELATAESALVTDGPVFGGGGGQPFHTVNFDPNNKITAVQIRSATEIDAIRVFYANGLIETYADDDGGTWNQPFDIFPGEELTSIFGYVGDRVDSIWLGTSTGRWSQKYGGNGGNRNYNYTIPGGTRVLGFLGRAADRIDAVGLVYNR